MDQKTLETLEFRKIQEMLAREADSPLGRERASLTYPGTVAQARELQKLGREIMEVLSRTSAPSLAGASDVRNKVEAASRGVVLSAEDLWHVLGVLNAIESVGSGLRSSPMVVRRFRG